MPQQARRLAAHERAALMETALRVAACDQGLLVRRSRHAATYLVSGVLGGVEGDVFFKLFDAPARAGRRLRRLLLGSPAAYVARLTRLLNEAGFAAPAVLLAGEERRTGRALLATERVEARALAEWLAQAGPQRLALKRAVLRSLGSAVARLHRLGFVHGDLTPYNVLLACEAPARWVFIDHERTLRLILVPRRLKLRNLVQLGRFELEGVTRCDRLRVFEAYARGLGRGRRRALLRRLLRMLDRRRRRDAAKRCAVQLARRGSNVAADCAQG
jgi:hypothetical protein